jgi:hypothetical protein
MTTGQQWPKIWSSNGGRSEHAMTVHLFHQFLRHTKLRVSVLRHFRRTTFLITFFLSLQTLLAPLRP